LAIFASQATPHPYRYVRQRATPLKFCLTLCVFCLTVLSFTYIFIGGKGVLAKGRYVSISQSCLMLHHNWL